MTRIVFAILIGLVCAGSDFSVLPANGPAQILAQDDQDQDQDIPRSDEEGEESEDSDEGWV